MTEESFEKEYGRALRRHYLARAKARAFAVAKLTFDRRLWLVSDAELEEIRRREVVRRYRNRACSCQMCRNPRRVGFNKIERLTLAERRALNSFREQTDDPPTAVVC